ncbi:hypothetical protein RYX56_05560 [Alkalihalophilus lindianensis]|uniref:Uncharacterized protein n=1 Tax=Alkalihalophilus lindianensis TaxID=1630542 RepID=A0ABU3X7G4_9BACI|nr:hypothetical protein [Alkalihalophilus lindianensis]MDV2683775.1 hypothetical protein [Alkalihalophilus lindianensis]MDV2683841.1 hypothetical protein [Alkalihalophilus lindianensis]
MKQTVKFNLEQQSQVIEALESYQMELKEAEVKRVDLIIAHLVGGSDQYDSEEMIYIVRALNAFSKVLEGCREPLAATKYEILASRVDRKREQFQLANHPLKKMSLA